MAKKMIKRKDGSYSQRGLWDNIRANRGSGKKPTKEMLKQERKINNKAMGGMRYYDHGGQHMNIPRHPGMANVPTPPPQGVIKPTDMSLSARMKRGADKIANFSMAPGGSSHGAPTQVLAEMTGIPSLLRLPQSYKNVNEDPSGKNIFNAAANTFGVIPGVTAISKGAGPLLKNANKALTSAPVGAIGKLFKANKIKDKVVGARDGGMRYYQDGGMALPGGEMQPIAGSDAVEFQGASHEEGGIELDPQTEVEGGETMDQVTMRDGGKSDYFFSNHLKHGGMPFSARHKQILEMGGSQKEIDMLAQIQEEKAGRDPEDVASPQAMYGGKRLYDKGGKRKALANPGAYEENGTVYDMNGGILYQDLNMNGMDDQDEGIISYERSNQLKQDEVEAEVEDKPVPNKKQNKGNYVKPDFKTWKEENGIDADDMSQETIDKFLAYDDELYKNRFNKPNLDVASDEYLSEFGDIPGYQGSQNIGDSQYYLSDDKLQKYITDHEDFGGEWMGNVDPEVLKAAGITDYTQLTSGDEKAITAYQNAWNDANPNNKIQVDGKFGEQTIRTGVPKLSNNNDDDTTPDDTPGDETPDETPIENGGGDKDGDKDKDNYGDVPDWKRRRGVDGLTAFAMGSQFLPAMSAMMDDPDYMNLHQVGSVSPAMAPELGRVYLDRVNMNTERERNAADLRDMNKAIENSGMGPAGIANRMAAYAKKQQGDRQIAAQEKKINVGIQNQETAINQDSKKTNIANMMNNTQFNAKQQMMRNMFNEKAAAYTDEFNRGADAATKDRRLMGLQNAVQTFAGINKDRLQFEAQERMAQAISGDSGVLTREEIARDLSKAYPNLNINSSEFSTKVENTYLNTLKNNSNG